MTPFVASEIAAARSSVPMMPLPEVLAPRPPPPRPVLTEDGRLPPTPAAKAAALVHPPTDRPTCVICMQEMVTNIPPGVEGRSEAIWCGHAFHSHCLSEWRIVAMKGPMDCPFRCQQMMLGLED